MPAAGKAYVYGIAVVAALAGLLFGFDTAIINGALVFLREQFQLSEVQTEIAAGSLLVGCIVGASIAGTLSDALGRKRILITAAVLFCLSSLATALPRDLMQFVVARLIAGTAIGVASVLAPLYIAEVSPAAVRGRLVTLNQMAIVTGILCAYFVSWLLSHIGASGWRWMFATAALPSLVFFVALIFIPESPRWLIRRGRDAEAMPILQRIGGDAAAALEMSAIRASLAEESGSWREVLAPGVRRPLVIATVLAVLSQVTGINTVIYYGSILFKEHAGSASASAAIWANVIIGLTNFLCTILAVAVIDKLGRKPLLLTGSAGMAFALGLLGWTFLLSPPPGTLILGLVLIYVAFFAISLGPGTWVYIAELFPTAVRGRAMSVATLAVWAACLLVTLTFLSLVKALGASGAFWLYGALCVATVIFVGRMIPETKGRTLEEIQQMWKK